jgi:hypothetical protein
MPRDERCSLTSQKYASRGISGGHRIGQCALRCCLSAAPLLGVLVRTLRDRKNYFFNLWVNIIFSAHRWYFSAGVSKRARKEKTRWISFKI